jgi:uncharacterized membrane protein YqiK
MPQQPQASGPALAAASRRRTDHANGRQGGANMMPEDVRITIGLAVLAAVLLAIAVWWLWWRLPKREAARLALKIRDAKARADVEDNYRKTVGQALGGVAVLLGTGLAYLQFSQQQRASDLQFMQQQRASHDLSFR